MNGYFFMSVLALVACGASTTTEFYPGKGTTGMTPDSLKVDSVLSAFREHAQFLSNGFDFPVGKPNGKGYYNAQPFTKNNHLGDDWNGNGGGNSDLGDTIYSISSGFVNQSINYFGGWGKVIRIDHVWKEEGMWKHVESLYAHMDQSFVKKGEWVVKGQAVGTIGTAEGTYLAHLHLEIRNVPGMELGAGYSTDTSGFVNPTRFIKAHRKIYAIN